MKKLLGKITDKIDSRQSSHSRGLSSSSSGRMPPIDEQQPRYSPQPPQHQHRPSVVIPPRRLPPLTLTPNSASPDVTGHVSEAESQKRKRDVEDSGAPGGHQRQKSAGGYPQGTSILNTTINYLPRANVERLQLIQGDPDTFSDTLNLIAEYEGVLERNESLAANLGAKLTGPRLLKGIERFFDGPIKTNSPQPFSNPISWLDVVAFAKAHPNDFVLASLPSGARCCQFVCKGLQVEIAEDDWRLISSGALDRFPLEHPFEEDETAEAATLDILEQRAAMLYNRAEEVAARARILHRRLSQRKHEISRRRVTQEGGSSRFSPVNVQHRPSAPGSYDLHADLLQQFLTAPNTLTESRSTSGAGVSVVSTSGPMSPSMATHHHRLSGQSIRSSIGGTVAEGSFSTPVEAGQLDALRGLITQRTEKLHKGDIISPPCDRCRRLRLQCVKHLTACQGCTKKHAKCSWKSVTDEEAARLRHEMGLLGPLETEAIIGADVELLTGLPRGSISVRIPEVATPPPSASVLLSAIGEPESRPQSRGDPAGMMIYSPKTLPNGRVELEPEIRRTSLPHGQGPGVGVGFGMMHLEGPSREHGRLSQVSTLSVSVAETAQSVGSLLNPDSS